MSIFYELWCIKVLFAVFYELVTIIYLSGLKDAIAQILQQS